MVGMAERAQPFQAFVGPDHASFLNPADMPQAIRDFCGMTLGRFEFYDAARQSDTALVIATGEQRV